jgi:hypothetical protein
MNELTIPGKITNTSLTLPPDLPYEQWEQIVSYLGLLVHGSRFWLGDAIEYGEHNYGQKYAQALHLTGLSYGRLSNITYTCRKVATSRRREDRSFEHHTVVAPLSPDEQSKWLEKAKREDWDPNELRDEIRKSKGFSPLGDYVGELESQNGKLKTDLRQARASVAALEAEAERELEEDPLGPAYETWERDRGNPTVTCPHCGRTFEVEA